jgi:hypothetical protein
VTTWIGNWDVAHAYSTNDGVFYNALGWNAVAGSTGVRPGTDATKWTSLAIPKTWRGLWSSATTYALLDAVYSGGAFWVATAPGTNQTPAAGSTYWLPATLPLAYKSTYSASTAYVAGDVVLENGTAYQLMVATATGVDPATHSSSWLSLYAGAAAPSITMMGTWNSATSYAVNNVVSDAGAIWQCVVANTNSEPSITNTNWQAIGVTGLPMAGSAPVYSLLTSLQANLAPPDGSLALVYGDSTAGNNGFWLKVGAPGAGSWSFVGGGIAGLNSLFFSTTAAGLAATATTTNKYFFVPGLTGYSAAALYQNVAGSAVLVGDMPTAASVVAINSTLSKVPAFLSSLGNIGFVLTDAAGNGLIQVTPSQVLHPDINAIRTSAAASALWISRQPTTLIQPGSGGFAFTDANGYAVMQVTTAIINHPDTNAMRSQLAALSTVPTFYRALASTNGNIIFGDATGYALVQFTPTQINHPDTNAMRTKLATMPSYASAVALESAFVVGDANGNAIARITPTKIDHPDINSLRTKVNSGGTANRGTPNTDRSKIAAITDLVYIPAFGQSLSVGTNGVPLISTTPVSYAYTFNGGVRTYGEGGTAASNHASLVGLAEEIYTNLGETPCSGMAQMIYQLLLTEDNVDLTSATINQKLLCSAPGQGGQTIAALQPGAGGGTFDLRLTPDVTYGNSLAASAGMSFLFGAVGFMEGDADTDPASGSTRASYVTAQRLLRTNMEALQNTVTGVNRTVPFAMIQVRLHPLFSTTPQIALAQNDLALDDEFCLAAPGWIFPAGADNIHYTNVGYKLAGAYLGLFIKRWLWDGIKMAPWKFEPILKMGNSIILSSAISGGYPWAFDTVQFDPGNKGFTLVDNTGTAMTITSAVLCGPKAVKITASATIPSGAKLRYGWIGASGAPGSSGVLRDTQGSAIVFEPAGMAYPMHNWCPIQEIAVP